MIVKITIDGDGLNYKGETSVPKAAQIIAFIGAPGEGVAEASSPAGGYSAIALPNPDRVSPREVLLNSGAKTNPQKIAVLGKYVSEKNGNGLFSTKEVQAAFRRAGEPLPMNFGRDVISSVSAGFVASQDESADEYYVTDLGLDLIASRFANAPKPARASSSPKGRKLNGKAKTSFGEAITALQIEASPSGMPNYWNDAFNKSAHIVWLLAYAESQGVNELSAGEVEYLAKKVGDNIEANTVPSKCIGLLKKGHIAKNPSGRFRVLKGGHDYLVTATEGKKN